MTQFGQTVSDSISLLLGLFIGFEHLKLFQIGFPLPKDSDFRFFNLSGLFGLSSAGFGVE